MNVVALKISKFLFILFTELNIISLVINIGR